MNRKYLPSFSELIDRLSINQIKEVLIPEQKEKYAKEIKDIIHDLNLILEEGNISIDAKTIRTIIVLAQINLHIWKNESSVRNGEKDGNLRLTHGLNGLRSTACNKIMNDLSIKGRRDFKADCLAEDFKDWEISWDE